MPYFKKLAFSLLIFSQFLAAEVIHDELRNRHIPIEITFPNNSSLCSTSSKCPVAFLSAGYGVSHTQYSFLSEQLNLRGYLVVAIGHELATDPKLATSGNLYQTRAENWQRGAVTLDTLQRK